MLQPEGGELAGLKPVNSVATGTHLGTIELSPFLRTIDQLLDEICGHSEAGGGASEYLERFWENHAPANGIDDVFRNKAEITREKKCCFPLMNL